MNNILIRKLVKTFADMREISLYKFICKHIDDSYAMSVLYACTQQSICKYLQEQNENMVVVLDGRYLGETIKIPLLLREDVLANWFSLLLSLRIIMLKPDTFDLCEDDRLLFYPRPKENFEWVSYFALIKLSESDEQVRLIYSLFENVCTKGSLSESEQKLFVENIKVPEFRNVKLYYRNKAQNNPGVNERFIGDKAFLEADFEEYTIHKDIQYIGDTAFAFCPRLKTLVFEGIVFFGNFPIIECPSLEQIMVPEEWVGYYQSMLPYYKSIIHSENKHDINRETKQGDENINNVSDAILKDNCTVEPKRAQEEEDIPMNPKDLEKLFEKRVTSYKFLWMIAILSLIKEQDSMSISYRDITIKMASFAWPLLFEDGLDFGPNDMMKALLSEVQKKTTLIPAASRNVVESYLKQHFDSQGIAQILSPLLKNTPYRFLSPWIKFTTMEEVVALSNSRNYSGLYALHDDSIILDEDWWTYIEENYEKIYKFTISSFMEYLKSYNSSLKLLKLNLRKY